MEKLNLKPQHEDTVIGKLINLKSLLDEHKNNVKPLLSKMENWEKKESLQIYNDIKNEISELKNVITENESVFNSILGDYNLTVTMFLYKHIIN